MLRSAHTALCWIAVASLLVASDAFATEWQRIAVAGDPAPGMPQGSVISFTREAAVRDDGTVRFTASGRQAASFEALYQWSPATGVALVVRLDEASAAIGDPPFLVSPQFFGVRLNPAGPTVVIRHVSLVACSIADSFPDEALFVFDGAGALERILGAGAAVPGIEPGWTFGGDSIVSDDSPLINAHGDLAFLARIERRDACDDEPFKPFARALFGPDGSGGITLAALPEQSAPGESAGAAFVPTWALALNDAGEIAFAADLRLGPTGPTVPAIYRWDATNGVRPVARKFAAAPGGGSFVSPAEFRLGEGGHLVFDDYFVSFSDPFGGLYIQDEAGSLRAIMRRGDVLPGAPAGFVVRDDHGFAVNADGDVAFAALVGPPNAPAESKWGIWAPAPGGARVLRFLDGQPAPQLEGFKIAHANVLALSDERRLLVETGLEGPGVNENHRAYYVLDASGLPQFLTRTGDLFETAPNQYSTLYGDLHFDAHLHHFAIRGRGSASESMLFYTTVPEPSSAISAFIAVATLATLRRRA